MESDDLLSAYEELSRSEYSWEELQARPLPPGVDPAKIETYLSDSVFMVSLGRLITPFSLMIISGEVQDEQGGVLRLSAVEAGRDEEGLRTVLGPYYVLEKSCDFTLLVYIVTVSCLAPRAALG